MAWTDPKIDWTPSPGVGYADMNKIGANLIWLKAHADATTGIHGAVSAPTPSKFVIRDASGRAQFVAPSAADDAAILATVTAEATARASADSDETAARIAADALRMLIAGGAFTGAVAGAFPDTDYTTATLRNIKLLTAVPGAGDLENGEIAFVYE